MRLLMFTAGSDRRLGVLKPGHDDEVIELSEPAGMLELIDAGEGGLDHVRSAIQSGKNRTHRLADVTVLSPLEYPRGNIIAMGRNYQKHAEESARKEGYEPKPPTIFTKAITSVTDPYADIAIDPAISDQIDWEAELAVVIGKRGANIKHTEAMRHIFGYTVLNDVTARDMQNGWGGQYFKGKSLDRSCPIGPWIVTPDEIEDVHSLAVRLRLNGTLKQDGNTRDMIYPIDLVIEWASKGMTLLPGAVIATGTPDGVGFYRTPTEVIRPGDVMETEVENVGVLRNRFVAAGD